MYMLKRILDMQIFFVFNCSVHLLYFVHCVLFVRLDAMINKEDFYLAMNVEFQVVRN